MDPIGDFKAKVLCNNDLKTDLGNWVYFPLFRKYNLLFFLI